MHQITEELTGDDLAYRPPAAATSP
jgi:hypothetical protein